MKANPVTTAPKGSEWLATPGNNLTALGSSQGTALTIPLGQDLTILTTVAAGTGVMLPGPYGLTVGEEYAVANHGTNALLVYPAVSGFVGNAAQNAGYSLAAGKTGYFVYVGINKWTANP